jgi:2-methylisocitrate lyase-like PEP mutase family enzyme
LPAAVKALKDVYAHLFNGGAPADLKDRVASAKEMDALIGMDAYRKRQKDYLR